MSDDDSDPHDKGDAPWYAAGHVPTGARCKPRPSEPLWTLTRNGHYVQGRLLYHGEWGVEFQAVDDGWPVYCWRFPLRSGAVAEAEAHRRSPASGRLARDLNAPVAAYNHDYRTVNLEWR